MLHGIYMAVTCYLHYSVALWNIRVIYALKSTVNLTRESLHDGSAPLSGEATRTAEKPTTELLP